MIKKCIIFAFLVTISCRHADEFKKMRAGNFDIVQKGTYIGTPFYLGQGGNYEDMAKRLRTNIEKNSDVLLLITEEFFPVSQELSYRFKFVALDREKNYLILRYFARIAEHKIYAGYQIQFVFDIHSERLVRVFTSRVPLE